MAETAAVEALREHLRTCEVHARYLKGYGLDAMTAAQLLEAHDDMPVRSAECRRFPGKYGR